MSDSSVLVTIKRVCERCRAESPVSRPFVVPTVMYSVEVGPRPCPVCGSSMNVLILFEPKEVDTATNR